jgi:hypothetical protein
VRSVPRAEFAGRVVDVSAGGVRAAFPPEAPFRRGQVVRFELTVAAGRTSSSPPPVRLTGGGRVLRVRRPRRGGDREVALAFDAPLAVHEAFPLFSVY